MKSVKAFAPATIGNVSSGFDVFGFAINNPGDVVEVTLNSTDRVSITAIYGDNGRLPRNPDENTATVAIIEYLRALGKSIGVELVLRKNLPLGSGMGSSAASAAAAVMAINHAMGSPMTKQELVKFATLAESVASGSVHADNVAPSIMGGFVLVRDHYTFDVVQIPVPKDLICVLAHPNIEVSTRTARQLIKPHVPIADAITQWANASALIAGLMKEDYDLIGRSLHDVIAEPVRSHLIPGFHELKLAAANAGAIGTGISGSGPALFSLCKGKDIAQKVSTAFEQSFKELQLPGEVYISEINHEGARIVAES